MQWNRNPDGIEPRHGKEGQRSLPQREFLRRAILGTGGVLLIICLGAGIYLARVSVVDPPSSASRPNIILLTADALRADHVGAYGYARPTTPHLDRLAAEAVLFEYAFATMSGTATSLASLHTGKYPREHFMHFSQGISKYQHTDPALAALLKAHGYYTAAIVNNVVLTPERSQMNKGFDLYDVARPKNRGDTPTSERNAVETTNAAINWLKSNGPRSPFFLWVHYIEPHGPYLPPPPYDTLFKDDRLYETDTRTLKLAPEGAHTGLDMIPFHQALELRRDSKGRIVSYNEKVADYIACYDGEIRYLDESIGRLLSTLKTSGLYDTAWLLFSSDHGESMGEHHFYFGHGRRLTLELIHVPLLVKQPGKAMPRRVGTQVSLIDLMPTLLEAARIDTPSEISGRSVLPLLRGERPDEPRLVFSDIGHQYSLIDDQYQLLVGFDSLISPQMLWKTRTKRWLETSDFNTVPGSLFAYRTDPLGEKDLVEVERAVAEARLKQLRGFLQRYRQRVEKIPRVKRPPVQDSARTRETLRQLGY